MKRMLTGLLLLALALLVGLVGCGTGGSSDNSTTQLQVDPNGLTVPAGEQRTITAQVLQNGVPVTNPQLTWSLSSTTVGTITQAGVFTATTSTTSASPAAGNIIVTSAGKTASIPVTVVPGALAHVIVTGPAGANLGSVSSGAALTFTAEGTDSYNNRGESRIAITPTWSVQGGIGTVSANGVFQATAAGTGKIVATVGSLQGSLDITVVRGTLSRIRIIAPTGFTPNNVLVNEQDAFTCVAEDANGNRGQASRVAVTPTWSVQGGIGSIDSGGNFTANTPGNGAIVASYQGMTDQLTIKVTYFAGTLVFERSDANHNLSLLSSDGTLTALSSGSHNYTYPSWSPDGSQILFMSQGQPLNGICTMSPDGSGASQLYSSRGQDPAWSNDGSMIAFSNGSFGSGEIDLITSGGTYIKKVAASATGTPRSPSWSPDDSQIAYYIKTGIGVAIDGVYTVDVSNPTHTVQLYQGSVQCVRWAPNPDFVSFSTGSKIYAYSLSGADPELLVDESDPLTGGFTWAPSQQAIIYAVQVNGYTQLRMKSLITMQTVQLTNLENASALNPSWKP
ncbi:MAG TPA: hypothetical protein VGM23_12040 [Armatimonadota bacterium]